MTPVGKVARLLAEALSGVGFSGVSEEKIFDGIWYPKGGERGLDIARWDVTVNCKFNGMKMSIHVHSWVTLSDVSRQKEITLIHHGGREFEA